MTHWTFWAWLYVVGCTPKHAPTPQVVVVPAASSDAPSPISGVLAGMGYVLLLSTEQQKEEIHKFAEAFERDRLPSDRLRLALLLTMADPSLREPTRARELIQGASFTADQGAYEALGRLVLALIEERDARAAEAATAAELYQTERARRRELEEKILAFEELERRVEALKALETGASRK